MAIKVLVRPHAYFDSVTLMQVSSLMAARTDVQAAAAVMATALSRQYLGEVGLLTPEAEGAGPNDLVIAVRAASAAQAEAAQRQALELLATRGAAPGPSAAAA